MGRVCCAARNKRHLAQQPVPEYVAQAYGLKELTFGADYFIPKPVDKRLIVEVSSAVARAAIESGVARRPIEDWDAYRARLATLIEE